MSIQRDHHTALSTMDRITARLDSGDKALKVACDKLEAMEKESRFDLKAVIGMVLFTITAVVGTLKFFAVLP